MKIKSLLKNNKGFSLLELIISSTATLIIMGSIFAVLIAFSQKSTNDQSRVRQMQESRFLLNVLSSDLKNVGSVIALANTGSFLADTAYFMGIYPLNKTNAPDGIIVASGDPEAVTKLTSSFSPSSSNNIPVASADVCSACTPWQQGDLGIIISNNGYYVFMVSATPSMGDSSITKRAQAIYYSGLLNSKGYVDTHEGASGDGNSASYPINAPVIRLTNFSIYLINEEFDAKLGRNRRDLVRVVDAFSVADVLGTNSSVKKYVMAENIWDIQIGYNVYPDFPALTNKREFFSQNATGNETLQNLIPELQNKTIREITVDIVALTDQFVNNKSVGNTEFETFTIPAIGDRASYTLPKGKYYYKIYRMLIEPKNFSTSL